MFAFQIFGLLLACLTISSAEYQNSVVLTNVGVLQNRTDGIREITCEVGGSEGNVIYHLEKKMPIYEIYNSSSYYTFYTTISENHYNFSIKKYDSEYNDFPATFSLYEERTNSNITFEIQEKNITMRYRNSTHQYNEFMNASKVLPLYQTIEFSIDSGENFVRLSHEYYGGIFVVYLRNSSSIFQMQIANNFVAHAEWFVHKEETGVQRIHVDRYDTHCWDSSNKTNNDTGYNKTITDFTIMIDTQYKFNQTMMLDLYKLKFAIDEEITIEYLNAYYADIKENYILSKELHKKIVRTNHLSRNEITVKNKYLRNNVFLQIREVYFEIVKSVEFNLNKLK